MAYERGDELQTVTRNCRGVETPDFAIDEYRHFDRGLQSPRPTAKVVDHDGVACVGCPSLALKDVFQGRPRPYIAVPLHQGFGSLRFFSTRKNVSCGGGFGSTPS
jgi:hypothetical protein